MRKICFTLPALILLFNFSGFSQEKKVLHFSRTIPISGLGGWDYLTMGPVNDWLYVSHGGQVNIIDTKTGDSAGVILNTTGVHGIAFDVENGKGFTSNGRLNTVTVFDIHTNAVLAQIAVGQNPDAIFYELYSKKIITCNGRSNSLTVIDPATNTVKDSVAVGGKPETAVSDGMGKMYVNIEDKNEIAVIDTKTFKVVSKWSLKPGEEPSGLAIDLVTRRLFSTCDKLLVVMDANNGQIIDKLAIGDGCDGVAFDTQFKNIYTSNGEGTVTVIKEESANKFSVIDTIKTKKGARTIALNATTHALYLPTAEFDPLQKDQRGRPAIKPNSFEVLVLEF